MRNTISATGVLRRIAKGKSGHEEITVLVKRPMIGDTILQFVLEANLTEDITVGTPIYVEGNIRGFYLRDTDGKAKVTQYFVANKVTAAKGDFESVFGVKGHFNPRHEIKVYIEGTVKSALVSSEGWKSLLVELDGTREVSDIITIGFRKNDRIPEFNDIRKDDRIIAALNVRSSKKTVKGENRQFQNLVVEDVVITNREINQSSDAGENQIIDINESQVALDYYEEDE